MARETARAARSRQSSCVRRPGAMATAPAVKPAPRPITSTDAAGAAGGGRSAPACAAAACPRPRSTPALFLRRGRSARRLVSASRRRTRSVLRRHINLRQAVPRRGVPAVGDEHARHRRQPPGEKHRTDEGEDTRPPRGGAAAGGSHDTRREQEHTRDRRTRLPAAVRAGFRSADAGRPRRGHRRWRPPCSRS